MDYFVTGATGFIGRHLLERLLARGGTVYALVREQSRARFDAGTIGPGLNVTDTERLSYGSLPLGATAVSDQAVEGASSAKHEIAPGQSESGDRDQRIAGDKRPKVT